MIPKTSGKGEIRIDAPVDTIIYTQTHNVEDTAAPAIDFLERALGSWASKPKEMLKIRQQLLGLGLNEQQIRAAAEQVKYGSGVMWGSSVTERDKNIDIYTEAIVALIALPAPSSSTVKNIELEDKYYAIANRVAKSGKLGEFRRYISALKRKLKLT